MAEKYLVVIGSSLQDAVSALQQGEIIALPTEAVYGLSCDPDNQAAVEKLLALKQREPGKGLILVSDDLSRLLPYIAPLTSAQTEKLLATWPGPITWVVPKAPSLPNWISGDHETIAIRVTAHPLFRTLCNTFKKPVVSTSANRSSLPPAKTAADVAAAFANSTPSIAYILDGALGKEAKPTQIRNLITDQLLRE